MEKLGIAFMLLSVLKCMSVSGIREFSFASGTNIKVASFLGSNVEQTLSTRSKIACFVQCASSSTCLSISYAEGVCELYRTYPPTQAPILGVHYIIYEKWCDVYHGFVYIRELNLCYRVIHQNVPCSDASNVCENLDATVIEIDCHEKQQFFEQVLENEMGITGTFLYGYFISGSWNRFDGSPLLYMHWDTAEPSGESQCIGMDQDHDYYWHDYLDENQMGVICEQKQQ